MLRYVVFINQSRSIDNQCYPWVPKQIKFENYREVVIIDSIFRKLGKCSMCLPRIGSIVSSRHLLRCLLGETRVRTKRSLPPKKVDSSFPDDTISKCTHYYVCLHEFSYCMTPRAIITSCRRFLSDKTFGCPNADDEGVPGKK